MHGKEYYLAKNKYPHIITDTACFTFDWTIRRFSRLINSIFINFHKAAQFLIHQSKLFSSVQIHQFWWHVYSNLFFFIVRSISFGPQSNLLRMHWTDAEWTSMSKYCLISFTNSLLLKSQVCLFLDFKKKKKKKKKKNLWIIDFVSFWNLPEHFFSAWWIQYLSTS